MHVPTGQSLVFHSSFSICCLNISKTPRTNFHLCTLNLSQTSQHSLNCLMTCFTGMSFKDGSGMYPRRNFSFPPHDSNSSSSHSSIGTITCLVLCTGASFPLFPGPHILSAEGSVSPGFLFHPHRSHF